LVVRITSPRAVMRDSAAVTDGRCAPTRSAIR
jgi:hypothetical protein